jgi:hypothetical protein
MHLSGLDLFFWVTSFVGHVVLLAILWLRQRVRRFPVFTALITFYVLRTLSLFFVLRYASKDAYFYTYWSLAIADVVLQLSVLFEAATHIFCPGGDWAPGVRGSLLWSFSASALVAGGLTALAVPATRTLKQAIVIRGNFFASLLIGELFVGMVVLSVTLGLPWRTHVARIMQGWGVCAIAGILIDALQSYFGVAQGTELYHALAHAQIAIYLASLVYWIMALAQDAPEHRALPDELNLQLLCLHRQTAVALSYLRLGKGVG